MRVDAASGERRDALAHGWGALLGTALPEACWLPVPNLGASVLQFTERWNLEAFILTGGDDVGTCPVRDATERHLLERCVAAGVPILGVCRGLQLVQSFCGGPIRPAGHEHDGGRVHAIEVVATRGAALLGRSRFAAPSFHRQGVPAEELHDDLEALAVSPDGLVEMLAHRSAPLVAVQWHPERPLADPEVALALLRRFFND